MAIFGFLIKFWAILTFEPLKSVEPFKSYGHLGDLVSVNFSTKWWRSYLLKFASLLWAMLLGWTIQLDWGIEQKAAAVILLLGHLLQQECYPCAGAMHPSHNLRFSTIFCVYFEILWLKLQVKNKLWICSK